jgi:hypothetical protein
VIENEDAADYETSEEVGVTSDFAKMSLREELLRGIFAYG